MVQTHLDKYEDTPGWWSTMTGIAKTLDWCSAYPLVVIVDKENGTVRLQYMSIEAVGVLRDRNSKSTKRCGWDSRCKFGSSCQYAHNDSEVQFRKSFGVRTFRSDISVPLCSVEPNVMRERLGNMQDALGACCEPLYVDEPEEEFPVIPVNVPRKQNYKTVLCYHYSSGSCLYGDECHFAHGMQDIRC